MRRGGSEPVTQAVKLTLHRPRLRPEDIVKTRTRHFETCCTADVAKARPHATRGAAVHRDTGILLGYTQSILKELIFGWWPSTDLVAALPRATRRSSLDIGDQAWLVETLESDQHALPDGGM
ncbi:hypothetical protein ACN38_g4521 [Penicillium nordicum]|uniref:Uncharacterized protein n=1 Tax=Penicillium nordicum TaxID=229535 RepID=A0A0M8P3W9_9EURO|nr:hypothetical protein ACN38_g4521 [Penicillium nordicum]